MKEQKDILFEAFFTDKKYNDLSEIDKLFHQAFIDDGGIMFKSEHDQLSLKANDIVSELSVFIKFYNIWFPQIENINIGVINSSKPLAKCISTNSLNVGLSAGLIIDLYKMYFAAFSTNNFWVGYGEDHKYHLKTSEFIENLDEILSTDGILLPNCTERTELASVLTNIALLFIIGHETTHAMDHQDLVDALENIMISKFGDNKNHESMVFKILELDADRFGFILSFRLAHHYYSDEYSDKMDGPTYLWLSSIALLYLYLKKSNKKIKHDLHSKHPNWSIRWGFIISYFRMYLDKTQDLFDDCYDIDFVQTLEERNEELNQFTEILEDRENESIIKNEYEVLLGLMHELNPFLRNK
ncbi:MAG: hypothetical protein IPJ51_25000 [Saprospiraceae bacterium]|nr:hypothetical protein [Saprospiraceae bacterium]